MSIPDYHTNHRRRPTRSTTRIWTAGVNLRVYISRVWSDLSDAMAAWERLPIFDPSHNDPSAGLLTLRRGGGHRAWAKIFRPNVRPSVWQKEEVIRKTAKIGAWAHCEKRIFVVFSSKCIDVPAGFVEGGCTRSHQYVGQSFGPCRVFCVSPWIVPSGPD